MGEKKTGRPTLKTPELLEEFCRRIGEGRSVASVCKDDDMPEDRAIWRWLARDESFSRDYARAVQARAMAHADRILDVSQAVLAGKVAPEAARVALDGMKWTASRLLPKLYGDRTQLEATVNHTHTLHLEALKELADRARGTRSGYIEGQATEIISGAAVLGGRPPADLAPLAGPPGAEPSATPPAPAPGGGRLRARHPRSLRTKTVEDHPPVPPAAPKTPRAKNRKGSGA